MNDELTDITIVLDRSGSMNDVRADTIGGFNTFLTTQQSAPGEATLSLVQFDNEYEVLYEARRIGTVQPLSEATFVPRGSTALLDAIGRTIVSAGQRLAAMPEAERPGKVLLVIITDGHENASNEFTRAQVFEQISHQREKYAWEVAFMGANQNAIDTGRSLGIAAANALNYASTSVGVHGAMRSLNVATSNLRKRKDAQRANFFDPAETQDAPPAAPATAAPKSRTRKKTP